MAEKAPWEQDYNQNAAPWERDYGATPPPATRPKVLNETHPDISWASRAIVKNFSSSPEAGLKYLQEQYPDFEFKFRPVGDKEDREDILVRKKGENAFRRLDPRGFDPADITDAAYDIGAGVLSTAAGAAAATAGAAAGGVPSIPAAMAASGGASAGLELIRQGAGSILGMQDNLDPWQTAAAGVAGGVAPKVFGAGLSTGQVGRLAAEKIAAAQASGIAAPTIREASRQVDREGAGILGSFLSKLGPRAGSAASGVSRESIEFAKDNLPLLRRMSQSPLLDEGVAFTKRNVGVLQGKRGVAGREMREALSDAYTAGVKVDVTDAQTLLLDAQKELADQAQKGILQPSSVQGSQKFYESVLETFDKLPQVADADGNIRVLADPLSAKNLLDELRGLSKYNPNRAKIDEKYAIATSNASKEAMSNVGEAAGAIRAELGNAVPAFDRASRDYKGVKDVERNLRASLRDESGTKAIGLLQRVASNPEMMEYVKRVDKAYGTDIASRAKKVRAFNELFRKGFFPSSAEGTTSTSRTIGAAALGAGVGYLAGAGTGTQGGAGVGGLAGGVLGAILGGPAAMRNVFIPVGRAQRALLSKARNVTRVPLETAIPATTARELAARSPWLYQKKEE